MLAMLGKAMRFATVWILAFAICGKADRYQGTAASKGTTEDLEHRSRQETNFEDHLSTTSSGPRGRRLAAIALAVTSADAFAPGNVHSLGVRPSQKDNNTAFAPILTNPNLATPQVSLHDMKLYANRDEEMEREEQEKKQESALDEFITSFEKRSMSREISTIEQGKHEQDRRHAQEMKDDEFITSFSIAEASAILSSFPSATLGWDMKLVPSWFKLELLDAIARMSTMCRSDFWDGVVLHENDQRDAQEKKRLERDEFIARLERDRNGKEVPASGTEQDNIIAWLMEQAKRAKREFRARHEWSTMIEEFYSSHGVPVSPDEIWEKRGLAEADAILSSFPSATSEEATVRWELLEAIGRLSAEGKRGFWARVDVDAQKKKREESGIDAQKMKREGATDEEIAYVGSDDFWRDFHSGVMGEKEFDRLDEEIEARLERAAEQLKEANKRIERDEFTARLERNWDA